MADLGQLVGTLLASLANARRITDEETVAIAEYYKDNPLLDGLSIPRIRVPEMVIDLPVLVENFDEGRSPKFQDTETISTKVTDGLLTSLRQYKIKPTERQVENFRKEINEQVTELKQKSDPTIRYQREHVVQIVDSLFIKTAEATNLTEKISPTQIKKIGANLRRVARDIALVEEGSAPKIEASIITAEVKERAEAGNVVRLHIVMKEEGIEWDVVEYPDGTTSSRLSPE